MEKIKVMTILGTRPEIIRLASVMAMLDKFTDHKLVHTGQNYDYELNQVFFEELEVREPDYFLNVDTSSLGKTLGEILIKTEEVLLIENPDAVLILESFVQLPGQDDLVAYILVDFGLVFNDHPQIIETFLY